MKFEFQQATKSDRDYLLALRKLTMVEHLEKSGQLLSDKEHEISGVFQGSCPIFPFYAAA